MINNIKLEDRDGMEIIEADILKKVEETSHILIIEMKKGIKYRLFQEYLFL